MEGGVSVPCSDDLVWLALARRIPHISVGREFEPVKAQSVGRSGLGQPRWASMRKLGPPNGLEMSRPASSRNLMDEPRPQLAGSAAIEMLGGVNVRPRKGMLGRNTISRPTATDRILNSRLTWPASLTRCLSLTLS